MNLTAQDFWQFILSTPDLVPSQRELLSARLAAPTPPVSQIQGTVCREESLSQRRSPFHLPRLKLPSMLKADQRLASELALSSHPLYRLAGVPGSGKTILAHCCATNAIQANKRVLILSYYPQTLESYQTLPGYPYQLSRYPSYQDWLVQELQQRHFANLQMDFLPLYLLNDPILSQLRTTARLETWLPRLEQFSFTECLAQLQVEFPNISANRLQLLALRLRQLKPLLEQQLALGQQAQRLSFQSLQQLASQLLDHPQVSVLATIKELWHRAEEWLQQTLFDLVIVEEAHYLSWPDLLLAASFSKKLILVGDYLNVISLSKSRSGSFEIDQFSPLDYLQNSLLPNQHSLLLDQFRLAPTLARSIYPLFSEYWVSSSLRTTQSLSSVSLNNPLSWKMSREHYPVALVTDVITELIQNNIQSIGVIVCHFQAVNQWCKDLQNLERTTVGARENYPLKIFDTVVLVLNQHPEEINPWNLYWALTRAERALIFVGDFDIWSQFPSPILPLIRRNAVSTEREVSLV